MSLVSLIANVIEPAGGTVLDPACGSGGMFVQSARVVEKRHENPTEKLTFYGLEKNATTIRLAKDAAHAEKANTGVRPYRSWMTPFRCSRRTWRPSGRPSAISRRHGEQKPTNGELKKTVTRLATLAETSRDLAKQTDLPTSSPVV